jgi:hypothetical protein
MYLTPIVPILPIIIFSAVAVAAAAIGAFLINPARRRFASALGLFLIRFAAVAVFATVLMNPEFAHEKIIRPGKPVLLLVDVSSVTVLQRIDENRLETAVLETYRAVLKDLEDVGFNTRVYFSAGGLFAVNGPGLPFGGMHETDLSESTFAEVLGEIAETDEPGAVVVISEGERGEVQKPLFPVFVFPITREQVPGFYPVSVRAPRDVLSGTRFPVEITFTGSGDSPFNYSVYEGDEKAAEGKGLPVSNMVDVVAFLNAGSEGGHFYKVETDTGSGPVWFSVDVLGGPIRVYFRSGYADPDAAFLRRAIAENRTIDCNFRQDLGGGKSIDGGPDSGVSEPDVIVLANPGAGFLETDFVADLEKKILGGTGLLIYYSVYPPDLNVLSKGALKDLSPVRVRRDAELSASGSPEVTAAGDSSGFHPAAVPEFGFTLDVGELKPSAVPLWVMPGGRPVLSWMRYGRGRVMLLTAGGLAEWELSRPDEQPGLTDLAADLVLFLYGGEDDFTLSGHVVESGEYVETYVLSTEKPTIVVGKTDRESERLSTYESAPGVWAAEWAAGEPGRYSLTARRFENGKLLVEKKEVLVTGRTTERTFLGKGNGNLARLAELSGGRYYPNGPTESFKNDIVKALESGGSSEITLETTPIIPLWFGLALFIGLLVTEWILRRLSGLI